MNRIIVVTGGAAGIGRCTVEYFASKGDRIYFIDNNQEATLALTERMHRKGLNVTGYTGDIAEKQVLEDFARRVLDEQPQGIHCLINNACLMHGGILEGCDYEDFLYIQRVGVAAPICWPNSSRIISAAWDPSSTSPLPGHSSHSPIRKAIRLPKGASLR